MSNDEIKADVTYSENKHDIANVKADLDEGLRKSPFDTLSLGTTLWIFRRTVLYAFMAFTLALLDAWQITIPGAIIANRGFIKQFGNPSETGVEALNTTWVSAWGAIINCGQIVAVTFISPVANRYGRKSAFYISWVAFVVCLLFLTLARTPAVWLLGKLFVGIAAGCQQVTVSNYIMEIAPTRIRGVLITFQWVWASFGGIICSVMLQVVNKKHPDFYLLPIYTMWGLAGIMIVCIIVVPESPWFLARRDRPEAAKKSLRRLNGTVPGYDVDLEYEIIKRTLAHEQLILSQADVGALRDCITGLNGRRTLLIVCLSSVGQWLGQAMISTYSTYFFSLAGLTDPFLATVIVSVVQLVIIICWSFTVDKVGRRYPVSIGYSIMNLTLWLMGILFYVGSEKAHSALLFLICLYTACGTVAGNSYWLQAAELPSAHLRIKTGTISLFFNACWGITSCFMAPPLLRALNLRAGFIYGGISLPLVVFFWFVLPETKGRAAAEIDELFERKVPAWRWSKTKTEVEVQMESFNEAQRQAV